MMNKLRWPFRCYYHIEPAPFCHLHSNWCCNQCLKAGILFFAVTIATAIHIASASCGPKENKDRLIWEDQSIPTIMELRDGRTISKDDLYSMQCDHQRWLETNGKEGHKFELIGNFQKLDLHESKLSHASLRGSRIIFANFCEAELYEADLSGSWMWGADMRCAKLGNANLRHADLVTANLEQAFLASADLRESRLIGANLRSAYFMNADLTGADFFGTDLKAAVFEPKPSSLPDIKKIAWAKNIELLTFIYSPHALMELREAFKKSGFREQERKITYAILHVQRIKTKDQSFDAKVEGAIHFVMFEMTCEYGMSPGRPLIIIFILILIFAIPYAFLLMQQGEDGIWQVWLSDRVRCDLGGSNAVRISPHGFRLFGFAFYFSLLSAFNIGWRELNVGNWISRMQPTEYVLRPSGIARVLSGFQSVMSVYLLALSVLTYFGRPFE